MTDTDRIRRIEDDVRALSEKLNDNKSTERVHQRLDRLRENFQLEVTRIEKERLERENDKFQEEKTRRNRFIMIIAGAFTTLIAKDIWAIFGG